MLPHTLPRLARACGWPAFAAALPVSAGCQPTDRSARSVSPTAPSVPAAAPAAAAPANAPAPRAVPLPAGDANPFDRVSFPPRNEPFQFRQSLEEKYRFDLNRGPTATFVDLEGDIVWTSTASATAPTACAAPPPTTCGRPATGSR